MTERPKRPTDTARVENALTTAVRQLYADPAAASSQAVDKIAASRVWLLKEKPFFGVLARALVVEPGLQTPAFRLTGDDRLFVNPLVVLEAKFPTLCARMAHLAMHAALAAFARRGNREPARWNVAHDFAIAPLLEGAGLLAGMATPPRLELAGLGIDLPTGASAEEYYPLLPEGVRPDDLWCDLCDAVGETASPPAGTFTRQDDGDQDPGEQPHDQRGNRPDSKSGETDDEDDDPGDDAEDDGPGNETDEVAPVEARTRELQWKMRLGAALEEERASGGKTFGELPAWIDDLVRATIEPPPDWSAALQRSIAVLTRSDRTFLRPSRRMAALAGADGTWPDVVAMPGRRVAFAGHLVAVIDTSASIGSDVLARFLGALAAAATAEGFDEIRLIEADAAITRDEAVQAADLLFQAIPIVGRGGTDFAPALVSLAAESRRTGERFTAVYLTDLDGRFPSAAAVAPLDVVWVTPHRPTIAPPFGQLLVMGLPSR